ncbi:hypothetical protein Tco_1288180, partial [Tanacetum coccineum]
FITIHDYLSQAIICVCEVLLHPHAPNGSTPDILYCSVEALNPNNWDSSEFRRSRLPELSFLLRRCNSCSIAKIVIPVGMHANLASPGDCLVFGKEVVKDNFGESRVVHLFLLFVTSIVNLVSEIFPK